MQNDSYTTWLEINLGIIRQNIRILQSHTAKPIMAIVKANAYGHGLVEVAREAFKAGAKWAGTARYEEAAMIRKAGIEGNLFVLGYVPPANIPAAIHNEIRVPIFDENTALAYDSMAQTTGKRLKVHLKIDSGMGRLGIFPEEAVEFVRWLKSLNNLELEGIFTHFARADEPALTTTQEQIQRFTTLLTTLENLGLRPQYVHASNSAGSVNFPAAWFDLVRPGIAIYGLSPSSQVSLPDGVQPAMTWKSRLCSIKQLPQGYGVGYGHRYTTRSTERIGVIAAGYADGFRRQPGNMVLIHGKRVPVVGSVCMDQSMILLQNVPEARIGDEVVILGKQGNEAITAEELAVRWNTINYDVCTGLASRIPRMYLET